MKLLLSACFCREIGLLLVWFVLGCLCGIFWREIGQLIFGAVL